MTDDDEVPFFVPSDEGDVSPRAIMERLIKREGMFTPLRLGEARIMIVMRTAPKVRNGRDELGSMSLPRFQGGLAALGVWLLAEHFGSYPDYVLTLDNTWWEGSTPEQKEALVFHELMHCEHATDREGELKFQDDGRPVWAIKGHDIEEFREVVRRYGDWSGEISGFVHAAVEGGCTG